MRVWRRGGVEVVERIDDAREADERVLDHLARLGCDPAKPRETHHYLYLPGAAEADAVAAVLARDDWGATIEGLDQAWLVVATRVHALTLESVRRTRAWLEALASEHGGVYDGWDATR
jgi:hypothetical protein